MRTHPLRPNFVLVFACLLAILFFLLDATVAQSYLWGSYLLPILVTFLWGRRRDIYIVATLASVLEVAAYWFDPAGLRDLAVNHLLPLVILWAAALLLAQRRQLQEQLAQRQEELDAQVAARTAALQASQEQLAKIFRANPGGIAISRVADGCFLDANPAYLQMLGYSREELVGHSSVELGILSAAARAQIVDRVRSKAAAAPFAVQLRSKTGATVDAVTAIETIEFGGEPCLLTMVVDETERKTAEREHAFLSALVDASVDAITSAAVDGTILTLNRSAEELYGLSAAAVAGQNIAAIVPPELCDLLQDAMARVGGGESMPVDDVAWRRPDGTTRILSLALSPVCDSAGQVTALTAIARDVTARKAAERERLFLSALVSSSPEAVVGRTVDGTILSWNHGAEQLFGYTAAEAVGQNLTMLAAPGALASMLETMVAVARGSAVEGAETQRMAKDGRIFDCQISSFPVRDAVGEIMGVASFTHDISQRKAAEREVTRLAAIVQNSRDAIISADLDGMLRSMNRAAEQLFGITAAEAIGQHISLINPDLSADERAAIFAQLRAGEVFTLPDFTWHAHDGRCIGLSVTALPLFDPAGRPLGAASIARDITTRKQMEEALAASERKYRDLYDNSPDMYMSGYPADHIIRDCNLTLAHTLGYAREELIGQPISMVYTPASYSSVLEGLPKYMAAGEYANLEVQLQRKDGTILAVLMSGHLDPATADRPAYSRVTFHDVTKRKQMEDALRDSEARLRAVIENTADNIWSLDRNYRLLVHNSAFAHDVEQQIGRLPVPGDSVMSAPFPSGARAFWQPLYDRAFAGESFMLEMPSGLQSGHTLALYLNPIYAADGAATGAACRAADITALKQVEKQLREANQSLQLAADAANIGIWNWNFADDSLVWDDRMCDFYAVPGAMRTSGLYYQVWREHVHPDDLASSEASLAAARRDGTDWSSTFRIVLPGGEVRHIYSACIVEHDTHGTPWRMVGINRDITDQRRYEQLLHDTATVLEQRVAERTADLQSALADLQRANQLKDEFMAMMSHELRTPLMGVLSMSEMLEEQIAGPLTARQATYVQAITHSGERLLVVVNSILGYTHLLSGKVQLHAEPCELAYLLDICAASQEHKAAEKQQGIAVQVDPPDLTITSDPTALAEVLKRLLDNAVKFTPAGGQIGIEAHPSVAPGMVDLLVWDTGIGIAPDQHEHVFHAFTQADGRLQRSHEGIGMGLAYVDEMVRLLGGTIALESASGQGSRFTVALPATLSAPAN